MRKLVVFNQVSLDGYFVDAHGDMRWAHRENEDAEWKAFVSGNARGGGILLFGRITYELMASYWPTPLAIQNDPVVAERMNALPKVVFSRTLDRASWENTTVVKEDPASAVRAMKQERGSDLAVMGSGTIVSQLTRAGLVDEFQVVVIPIILGRGRTMFDGIDAKVRLQLTKTRTFCERERPGVLRAGCVRVGFRRAAEIFVRRKFLSGPAAISQKCLGFCGPAIGIADALPSAHK
jgi:dihydrofolate reductase